MLNNENQESLIYSADFLSIFLKMLLNKQRIHKQVKVTFYDHYIYKACTNVSILMVDLTFFQMECKE